MYQSFKGGLGGIALAKHGRSRAINAENPHGEKGKGGMAASHLGPSRKGSPCLNDIEPGATVTLAEMEGPGEINHIWITVDNKTTDADCFVLRDLVIRMYWDDEETPSVESPLGDFFCCGFGRECIVNSVPMAVVPSRGFNCYFPMHPYTRSLISAIPIPDPNLEKHKVLFSYDPSQHDYSEDKPELTDIGHGHFVFGNKKEIEEYKRLREEGTPIKSVTIAGVNAPADAKKSIEKLLEEINALHKELAEMITWLNQASEAISSAYSKAGRAKKDYDAVRAVCDAETP